MNNELPQPIREKIIRIAQEIKASGKKYFTIHYIGANSDTAAKIVKWWHTVKQGWSTAGYHHFLNWDGVIEDVEPVWKTVNGMSAGWGANYKWTKNAYQIVFETVNKELKMHPEQEKVLISLIKEVIALVPDIQIGGHREFPDLSWRGTYQKRQNTQCPNFSVEHWLERHGVSNKNIFYRMYKP